MKFSIITATYNRPIKLKTMIQSVVDQKYQNWELIIVDDCSTENNNKLNKSIVESFNDDRIFYHHLTINGKQCHARNVGLTYATGEWIRYLDDDDIFYPNCLNIYQKYIKKYQKVKVFTTKYKENEHINGVDISKLNNPYDNWELDTCCLLHHIDCYKECGGWDETLRVADDYELIMRYCLAYANNYHFIPEICAQFNFDKKDSYLFGKDLDCFGALKKITEKLSRYKIPKKAIIVNKCKADFAPYLYGMNSFYDIKIVEKISPSDEYDVLYLCNDGALAKRFFTQTYHERDKMERLGKDLIIRRF